MPLRMGVSGGSIGGATRISVIRSGRSTSWGFAGGGGGGRVRTVGEGLEVGRDKVLLRGVVVVVVVEARGLRRTCLADVQALRRCVKQLRPSLTRISSSSRRRRRALRSSAVRRSVSPTPSGLSKRNGSLLFAVSMIATEPTVPMISSSLSDTSLIHSSRSLQSSMTRLSWLRLSVGVPGSPAFFGHVQSQSSLIFPANMRLIASFCFDRSLLVRSASYSVRALVVAIDRRR